MNPPFSMFTRVVNKIIADSAFGILIIPVWPRFVWFHVLGRIALDWLDIPPEVHFFENKKGVPLPQRSWGIRAVLFNAFGAGEALRRERAWGTIGTRNRFCKHLQSDC